MPIADYASAVWFPGTADKTIALLKNMQRTAAQAITHGFRTVSLEIAETEAAMLTAKERLRDAAVKHWVRLQGLPLTHPLVKLINRLRHCRRFTSPLQRVYQWGKHLLMTATERLAPFSEAPWDPPIRVEIRTKDEAKTYARNRRSSWNCTLTPRSRTEWRPLVDGTRQQRQQGP